MPYEPPDQKQERDAPWQAALAALRRNQCVGFPTETVWGLGAAAFSEEAVLGLSRLKGRGEDKVLQLSCLDIAQALALAAPGQPALLALSTALPGPLTLVAWAAPSCPAWLQREGKVGLRIPDHPTIQELLRRFDAPLATTSLNPTGLLPARNAAQAQAYGLAAVVLDEPSAGLPAEPPGLPSTVVDCTSGAILREGAFPAWRVHELLETR